MFQTHQQYNPYPAEGYGRGEDLEGPETYHSVQEGSLLPTGRL